MEAADVVRGRRGGRRGSQGRLDDGEARRIAALGALGTIKHVRQSRIMFEHLGLAAAG